MRLTTDPETGVRSFTPSFQPGFSDEAAAAHSRDLSRAHLVGIDQTRIRAEAIRAEEAAAAARERAVRFENPYLPLPPATDLASCRSALASLLGTVNDALSAERITVGRIIAAIREQGEAESRHASARDATVAAREAGAASMKGWLEAGCQGGRPDAAAAVSTAVMAEAAALAEFEVMTTALDAMQLDHEAARLLTEKARYAVEVARDRIFAEHAVTLAAELTVTDERGAALRRSLTAYCRSAPVGPLSIPAAVSAALHAKPAPSNPGGEAETGEAARWRDLRAAMMLDPQTELPGV